MDKNNKPIVWTVVILLLMTTDFSSMCRHGARGATNAFSFNNNLTDRQAVFASPNSEGVNFSWPPLGGEISWKQLADVSYVLKYNKQFDGDVMYPVFGNNVKKLAGKQWVIAGYMIPLDIKSGLYAISQNSYTACFFCGGAGVESVISLKFKAKPKRYKTDEYCYIKGTLELNDNNVNDFVYIFRNAEEVKK